MLSTYNIGTAAGGLSDKRQAMTAENESRDERKTPAPGKGVPTRVVRSDELLAGRRQLLIDHEGQVYRLLLTKNGKLILQK